ncbi:hypothetical protein D3C72_2260920 [compost metagenome]
MVNEKTFGRVASMFYGPQNEGWMQLILSTDQNNLIKNKLNSKFNEVVNEKLASCGVVDEEEKDEVKSLIATALEKEIDSINSLEKFLSNYVQDKMNNAGQQRKYFS